MTWQQLVILDVIAAAVFLGILVWAIVRADKR